MKASIALKQKNKLKKHHIVKVSSKLNVLFFYMDPLVEVQPISFVWFNEF